MNLDTEAKKQLHLRSLVAKNNQPVKLSNLIYEKLASMKHQVENFKTRLSPKHAKHPSVVRSIDLPRDLNKTL